MLAETTIGGRRVSYFDTAGRVQGAGVPPRNLVLLHGFPLTSEMWRPQVAALPSGWRMIAPDLRGFGRSDPMPQGGASGVTVDDYASDVLELLGRLRIDTAVVGGVSMGGYVVFAIYRRAPRLCGGLVLADTRPQADSDPVRVNREKMLDLLHGEGPPAVVEEMLPRLLGAKTRNERAEVVALIRSFVPSLSVAGMEGAIRAMMARPDSTELLSSVSCPTLIVVGEEDELTPVDDSRQMHGQIAEAELAIIGSAGHLPNLERPAEFNAVLARFLSVHF
jgi:3-oxoadipate enol-lactonase